LGYQVQSLVSIDVPPVAILHFVFAGAVILLSRPVELRVFGRDRPPSRNDAASTAGAVVIGALALLGAWLVLRPLRADVAAADARNLQTSGAKPALRVEQLRHAVGLAPWEPRYVVALAAAYQAEGQSNDALETGERAARLDPGNTTSAIAAANAAEALGAQPRAEQWYRTAVRHDPHYAGAHDALGRYLGRMNRRQESVRALRRATQLSPSTASYWRDYGEALAGVRRYEPAVAALERALEIEPNWPAQQLLEQLKRALATQG
jgi:tetratricopeptide (TPR) repeat protein